MQKPRVSIVTPSFNQASFIDETLRSVLEQDYEDVEYIVIDGGSTDNTVDILKGYNGRIRWISEADRGQADAINKGFQMATGDIFGWLNADDLYVPGAIRAAVDQFMQHPQIFFIYGDVIALNEAGQSFGIRTHVKQADKDLLINFGDYIVQPGAFWRRTVWETVGNLDENLHYALDYDYWMRVSRQYEMLYVPICFAKERLYSSAKTFSGSFPRLDEIEKVSIRNGGDGLPKGFHAEAAATYTVGAIKAAFTGRWQDAQELIRGARRYQPPIGLFLRYFVVMLLLGHVGIARMWLYLNRFRQNRKSTIVLPEAISTR